MKASSQTKVIEMLRKASLDPRVTKETRQAAAKAMRNQMIVLRLKDKA